MPHNIAIETIISPNDFKIWKLVKWNFKTLCICICFYFVILKYLSFIIIKFFNLIIFNNHSEKNFWSLSLQMANTFSLIWSNKNNGKKRWKLWFGSKERLREWKCYWERDRGESEVQDWREEKGKSALMSPGETEKDYKYKCNTTLFSVFAWLFTFASKPSQATSPNNFVISLVTQIFS